MKTWLRQTHALVDPLSQGSYYVPSTSLAGILKSCISFTGRSLNLNPARSSRAAEKSLGSEDTSFSVEGGAMFALYVSTSACSSSESGLRWTANLDEPLSK